MKCLSLSQWPPITYRAFNLVWHSIVDLIESTNRPGRTLASVVISSQITTLNVPRFNGFDISSRLASLIFLELVLASAGVRISVK